MLFGIQVRKTKTAWNPFHTVALAGPMPTDNILYHKMRYFSTQPPNIDILISHNNCADGICTIVMGDRVLAQRICATACCTNSLDRAGIDLQFFAGV